MAVKSAKPPSVAYSYIRFSSPQQAEGDSLRRQTEAAAAWCQRYGVRLDTGTTFRDLGKSAYLGEHRRNPDRNALAAFLKLVHEGRVAKGAYLIIENLDRLSREHERAALRLWLDILDAGVSIVQLSPEVIFRHEQSDMFDVMRAIMELSRGHGESKVKSERVGAAWKEKKRQAANGGGPITTQCPAWLRVDGGKFKVIAERAAAVRRIFELAADGHGMLAIVHRLTEEGVPPIGWARRWTKSYVALLLRSRECLGEYHPTKVAKGKANVPDGPPVLGYYPAVVSEQQWQRARAAVALR
jgi:DNA invertase Pin-like site-specific DNA recombinase